MSLVGYEVFSSGGYLSFPLSLIHISEGSLLLETCQVGGSPRLNPDSHLPGLLFLRDGRPQHTQDTGYVQGRVSLTLRQDGKLTTHGMRKSGPGDEERETACLQVRAGLGHDKRKTSSPTR